MYKGAYLFGNRIVAHKIPTISKGKVARGSASFAVEGGKLQKVRRVANKENRLFDLRAEYETTKQALCKMYQQAQNCAKLGASFAEINLLYQRITESERKAADLEKKIKLHELSAQAMKEKQPKSRKDEHYLNKAKVRDKCTAFFELEASQKFCAFYSVSFPAGMPENVIYKCWNSWLTNLRKTYGLKDYIWVAEYQQNGTLHYHMLCNVRMDIKRTNKAMGICLFHQGYLQTDICKYNGVDVKKVHGSRENLNAYLTKYVSKQESFIYKHSPWRCSQSVSALFTSVRIDEQTSIKLAQDLSKITTQIYENDFAVVEYFNIKNGCGQWYNIPNHYRKTIIELNNQVIKQLEREKYEKIYGNSIFAGASTCEISQCGETRPLGGMVQLPLFPGHCDKSLRQGNKAIC